MKELITKILREESQKKFSKAGPNKERFIIQHMENVIGRTTRILPPPEDNYGNYGEEWCVGGKVVMEARYYFNSDDVYLPDEEKFYDGFLMVDKDEVDFLSKMLQVRKAYILNVITEWYDEKYTTKFGQEVGHPELEIDETTETDNPRKCYQMVDTSKLSREDIIDYLDTQTLKKRSDLERLPDNELESIYRSVYNSRLNRE